MPYENDKSMPAEIERQSKLQSSMFRLVEAIEVLEQLKQDFENKLEAMLSPVGPDGKEDETAKQEQKSSVVNSLDGMRNRLDKIIAGFSSLYKRYEG